MKTNVFEYKGYVGSIDFSVEDKILNGKILFINDLVTYEAETLPGLEAAFNEAVDFYLQTCAEEGLVADKPCSGSFNVRIPQDVHRSAQVEAARRGQSLNDFVRESIENELSGNRSVTIHAHEHKHTHMHAEAESVQYEAVSSSTYKEVLKWKHESSEPTRH
ncbi:MAG: type II toxin-antitoxin system HicB family antitoxin [Paraburkholderia sp.]|jgi:predicted HicB family RNase H-like nuclease|nr:type II toxin-antitoxin system HicB family antitoxin [Paraburkholderia sp.]